MWCSQPWVPSLWIGFDVNQGTRQRFVLQELKIPNENFQITGTVTKASNLETGHSTNGIDTKQGNICHPRFLLEIRQRSPYGCLGLVLLTKKPEAV